jgi:hypothetical protein
MDKVSGYMIIGFWVGAAIGTVLAWRSWPGHKGYYFGRHLGGTMLLGMTVGTAIGFGVGKLMGAR